MMGNGGKQPLEIEKQGFISKMGKGVYLIRPLKAGTVIKSDDLCVKSPAGGMKPHEIGEVIGKALISDLSTGVALERGMYGGSGLLAEGNLRPLIDFDGCGVDNDGEN